MQLDPIQAWARLPVLSVVEAAILLAGGDPEEGTKTSWEYDGQMPETILPHYKEFQSFFGLLRRAILSGSLPAKIGYPARLGPEAQEISAHRIVVIGAGQISSCVQNDVILPIGEGFQDEWMDKLVIERAPDWTATTILTADLSRWLKDMEIVTDLFGAEAEIETDDLLDTSHPHYSEELALAVHVWRALKNETRFPRGPKNAILKKISEITAARESKGSRLSGTAEQRIATLVNWKPEGGAPSTGT